MLCGSWPQRGFCSSDGSCRSWQAHRREGYRYCSGCNAVVGGSTTLSCPRHECRWWDYVNRSNTITTVVGETTILINGKTAVTGGTNPSRVGTLITVVGGTATVAGDNE
jgi:uncharacterized Zn-binding protein involved in type VI secretion